MKIVVVGTGYVGLVVGMGLAESGHVVTCVDRDRGRIEQLAKGLMPIYEPGLEELVIRNMEEERLFFTSDLETAVKDCLLILLCVGTPLTAEGTLDTSDTLAAAKLVGEAITGYRIIVNKSTCPVGTAEKIRDIIGAVTSHPFDVVANPEFLKEGAAVEDFMRPDRIIIGCEDVRVQELMRELYAPFLRTGKPFLTMNIRSAELCKLACNVALAVRISLMNELSLLCEHSGADIAMLREGMASDSRIGPTYLFPGLGFGGSCLPKDVQATAHLARSLGLPCDLMDAVTFVNTRQTQRFIERILTHYGDALPGKLITVWGATFKPRTDDLRNSPALKIIDVLLEKGARVAVYDPAAGTHLKTLYGDRITVGAKNYPVLEGANGLVICTEWNEFRRPDYERMATLMKERVIFDGRNLYTPSVMARQGFLYYSVGRPTLPPTL